MFRLSSAMHRSARSIRNGRIFIWKGDIPMCIPVVDLKKTGQNIAALREQKGISVKELQQLLGFATPQAIYKWQQGVSLLFRGKRGDTGKSNCQRPASAR